MSGPALNLVVLRSADMARAVAFYSLLGLTFEKHRHGNGPEHYSAEMAGIVFEIYPEADEMTTIGTRVGFRVPSIDAVLAAMRTFLDKPISTAKDSEWGRRAVVTDPDGHRVELVEG